MNQCDGCCRGLPVEDGLHYEIRDGKKFWVMGCTKENYEVQ